MDREIFGRRKSSRLTNSSLISQDLTDFCTENFASWEAPQTQENWDGWSPQVQQSNKGLKEIKGLLPISDLGNCGGWYHL